MGSAVLSPEAPPRARAMPGETEQQILSRARAGDQEAFRRLVERFTPRVFAVARNLVSSANDAEDVTQEVFFKVHAKLDSFREQAAFSTWLYRVTVNAAADHLKKRRQERASFVEDPARLPVEDPGDDPGRGHARQDLRREVRRAMGELPEKFRTILVLRELEGLSYAEISGILGCSKGTVESRLFRARSRLREHLQRAMKEQ